MTSLERTLGAIVDQVDQFELVPKENLSFGDCVRVTTLDAIYSIHVLEDGVYAVSAGGLIAKVCPRLERILMVAPGVEVRSRWTLWQL